MSDMETYQGNVRTPQDAIILFEACRLGILPRVQRRLSEKERQNIRTGSVFVWDEREAGMRRWTDGKSWSASRVSGSFLTYREMEGKRGGNVFNTAASRAGKTPESTKGSDEDTEMQGDDGPDGYRYKPDGLMKQSFSITTSTNQHLHLISYYSRSHPIAQVLLQPSSDISLRHVRPPKGMYPESTVHDNPALPAVTRSPMPTPAYTYKAVGASGLQNSLTRPSYGLGPYGPPAPAPSYPLPAGAPSWPQPPPLPSPAAYSNPIHSLSQVMHQNQSKSPSSPGSYGLAKPHTSGPPGADSISTTLPPPNQSRPPTAGHPGPYPPNHSPRAAKAMLIAREAQSHLAQTQSSLIDPRLTGSSENTPSQGPPPSTAELPNVEVTAAQGASSNPNAIPGIGAMINGPRRPPQSLDSHNAKPGMNGSVPPGRSPGGPNGPAKEGLDFGEDIRALRQLDKVFKA